MQLHLEPQTSYYFFTCAEELLKTRQWLHLLYYPLRMPVRRGDVHQNVHMRAALDQFWWGKSRGGCCLQFSSSSHTHTHTFTFRAPVMRLAVEAADDQCWWETKDLIIVGLLWNVVSFGGTDDVTVGKWSRLSSINQMHCYHLLITI